MLIRNAIAVAQYNAQFAGQHTEVYLLTEGDYQSRDFVGIHSMLWHSQQTYRVGDRVRVCSLPPVRQSLCPIWEPAMDALCGHDFTVIMVTPLGAVIADSLGDRWTMGADWIALSTLYGPDPIAFG